MLNSVHFTSPHENAVLTQSSASNDSSSKWFEYRLKNQLNGIYFTVNRLNASDIRVVYSIVFSSPCTASCHKHRLCLLAHFRHNTMVVGSVLTARCQAGAWQATLNAKVAAHSFWHTCFTTL